MRSVAVYQKGILVCILFYFIIVVASLAVDVELQQAVRALVLPVGLVGTVFVFLLATKIYKTGVGILLGILTLIPCVGLIVLVIVNGKATGILQKNGHKVGLMGAKLSEF